MAPGGETGRRNHALTPLKKKGRRGAPLFVELKPVYFRREIGT